MMSFFRKSAAAAHLSSSATADPKEDPNDHGVDETWTTTAYRKKEAEATVSICMLCYEDLLEETDELKECAEDVTDLDVDLESGRGRPAGGGNRLDVVACRRVDLVACRHSYCLSCLEEYFQYSISIHRVPIPCPSLGSNASCGQYVPPEIVRRVLLARSKPQETSRAITTITTTTSKSDDDEYYWIRKFTRLHRLAQDPALVSCPRCDELVSTSTSPSSALNSLSSSAPSLSSPSMNMVVCPNLDCQHEFCSLHGDLHLGLSCSVYCDLESYKKNQGTQPQDEQQIFSWGTIVAKPCSHCGMALWKHAGCDHVVCPACHQDMCYRCGTHVHLSGKVIRSCSQCQQGFVDHRYNRQYQCRLWICLPLLLPGWILYILVTGLFAAITCCFCGCFLCGWKPNNNTSDNNNRKDGNEKQQTSTTTSESPCNTTSSSSAASPREAATPSSSSSTSSFDPIGGVRKCCAFVFLPVLVFLRDVGVDRAAWWLSDSLEQQQQQQPEGGGGVGSQDDHYDDIPILPIVNMAATTITPTSSSDSSSGLSTPPPRRSPPASDPLQPASAASSTTATAAVKSTAVYGTIVYGEDYDV